MDLIQKYFPELSEIQISQFEKLIEIIPRLNQQVNVISRKDIEHLEERHILHSLAIAMKFSFSSNQLVIDAGTGGGFPGIPLAILFPQTKFILVDSTGKKIRLVDEVVSELGIGNVSTLHGRVEDMKVKADFVVSRAVTALPKLHGWTRKLLKPTSGKRSGGMIALKGGDLEAEIESFKGKAKLYPISAWFEESFFSSKLIVYLNN